MTSDNEEFYEQSIEGEDEAIVISPDVERRIIWQPKDFTIRELHNMKVDGDLDLQPIYQRNFVIDKGKASRLIESILMDVPIPVIYLAEEYNNTYSVIDGQQRLTSFISFIDGHLPGETNDFKLSGLKILKELNKKKFSELDRTIQTKIRTTALHTIIIKKESHEDIKFEIFERLNTGSTRLNEDELRNSVYRGTYIDLLKELSENEDFHTLVKKDNYKKRMIYRGMILRFLAMSERSYINYKPSIKQFCNKELRDNRNINSEKRAEYTRKFNHSIELCKTVFGKSAFRRFLIGTENEKNGKWISTRINMALYDIQMCGFALYEKNQIVGKSNEIREALLDLMTENEEFIRAIEIQTSDREQVTKRFKIWFETLENIVSARQRRSFSFSEKLRLYEGSKTCALCGQEILLIEDAEVDHVVPFSQGGSTTIENAQLAHRYCNRKKGNRNVSHGT